MIERDFIMRLIRQFFEALNDFLSSSKKDKSEDIIMMYNTYVGPSEFLHGDDIQSIIKSFDKYGEEERLYRMEMLAELYLAESKINEKERESLLRKSYILFQYINANSNTYSFDRINKIQYIAGILNTLSDNN